MYLLLAAGTFVAPKAVFIIIITPKHRLHHFLLQLYQMNNLHYFQSSNCMHSNGSCTSKTKRFNARKIDSSYFTVTVIITSLVVLGVVVQEKKQHGEAVSTAIINKSLNKEI